MRDVETIDQELRLVAGLRRFLLDEGESPPDIAVADRLLDERSTAMLAVADGS